MLVSGACMRFSVGVNKIHPFALYVATAGIVALSVPNLFAAGETPPNIPRFSIENMDRSVEPADDFYHFATGNWIKKNPVPSDKSRWSGFEELQERNWQLIHEILEATAADR